MRSEKRALICWVIVALTLLTAIFVLVAMPAEVGAGSIVDKIHHEGRASNWPLNERWFFVLDDGKGHQGRVEVTREEWESRAIGERWPK